MDLSSNVTGVPVAPLIVPAIEGLEVDGLRNGDADRVFVGGESEVMKSCGR